jgi:hypothetical protein
LAIKKSACETPGCKAYNIMIISALGFKTRCNEPKYVHFFARSKEKAPSSLAFGSPRETLYRGGSKNSLRSNNSRLIPLSSASLSYAATGLKPKS